MTEHDQATTQDPTPGAARAPWRTWTGWILTCFSVALFAVVVGATVVFVSRGVYGDGGMEITWATFGLGPVAATCGVLARLLLRSPGPWRDSELGVGLGSGSFLGVALLCVLNPAAGLVALFMVVPLLLAAQSWVSAALTGGVVVAVVLGCRAWRRRGGPARRSWRAACVLGVAYVTFGALVALVMVALTSIDGFFRAVP